MIENRSVVAWERKEGEAGDEGQNREGWETGLTVRYTETLG